MLVHAYYFAVHERDAVVRRIVAELERSKPYVVEASVVFRTHLIAHNARGALRRHRCHRRRMR